MAEDGLLLNFELPSDAFTAPALSRNAFKGGTWKDRLTARKSAEYGRKKAQERAAGLTESTEDFQNDASTSDIDSRRTKRPRTDNPANSSTAIAAKLARGEFISSLFTYNPASTTTKAKDAEDATGAQDGGTATIPSNAPLDDEFAKFTNLGLSKNLASHLLQKMNITAPTAIQRKAIQLLCAADTDAFIQAQTGSGKTLAYLLPVVERICAISRAMKDASLDAKEFSRETGLFAIILAPTRELSKQISSVLDTLLTCCHWIVAGTVIGGEKKKSEKARLRRGLNILVATPGRLADHLNHTEVLDVSRVRWLVLDEGDRLMELGFEQDLQKIIGVLNLRAKKTQEHRIPGLPDRRTTVLCSATIKANVEHLQSISLKDPVSIAVDTADAADNDLATLKEETAFSAPAQLKQSYAIVPAKQRLVTLIAVLRQTFRRKGSVMKCVIFISCADSVDFHFEVLTQQSDRHIKKTSDTHTVDTPETHASPEPSTLPSKPRPHKSSTKPAPTKIPQGTTITESHTHAPGNAFSNPTTNPVHVFRLHGSLQQATRTSTLKAFTDTPDAAVLVCTDVASRGLDLPNVDLVIEYDAPFSSDDHLHRIGRTARAGRSGRAMIFLQPGCEEGYVDVLRKCQPRNSLTRHDAEEFLRKGFGVPLAPTSSDDSSQTTPAPTPTAWDVRATDFQIDVERWTLDHAPLLEQARRAYQSHIRAYATHVAAERQYFNLQELHLGHLAKAFGLRDRPASIRVPGLRPGDAGSARKGVKRSFVGSGGEKRLGGREEGVRGEREGPEAEVDVHAARRKMLAKTRGLGGGASEFNLG